MRNLSLLVLFVALFTLLGHLFFDLPLHIWLLPISQQLHTVAQYYTLLGDGLPWLVLSSIVFFVARFLLKNSTLQNGAIVLFSSIIGAGLVNFSLKLIFGRYRPYMYDSYHAYGFSFFASDISRFSFPSGHSNTFFAVATVATYYFPKYIYFFYSFAILGAFSRLLLNKHYLTDVVAGGIIGILCTLYIIRFYQQKGLLDAT